MKRLISGIALLVVAATPHIVSAQFASDSTSREMHEKLALYAAKPPEQKLCFRAQGCPNCDTIILLEFALGKSPETCGKGPFVSSEFGLLRNISSAYGVGGTVFYGGDDCGGRFGFRGRLRHWIAPNLGLDIAPGIVLTGDDQDGLRKFPAFSGQIALDFLGLIGPIYQLEMQRSKQGVHWDSIVGFRSESYAVPVMLGALIALAAATWE